MAACNQTREFECRRDGRHDWSIGPYNTREMGEVGSWSKGRGMTKGDNKNKPCPARSTALAAGWMVRSLWHRFIDRTHSTQLSSCRPRGLSMELPEKLLLSCC